MQTPNPPAQHSAFPFPASQAHAAEFANLEPIGPGVLDEILAYLHDTEPPNPTPGSGSSQLASQCTNNGRGGKHKRGKGRGGAAACAGGLRPASGSKGGKQQLRQRGKGKAAAAELAEYSPEAAPVGAFYEPLVHDLNGSK